MRRAHLEHWQPHCPACAGQGAAALLVAEGAVERDGDVLSGMLVCSRATCRHEYPVVDGVPVVMADLPRFLAERGIELLLRDDLPPDTLSLIGDALGPDSWFDASRQGVSTYAWDGYADLDPGEAPGAWQPGAARRCLARLLALCGDPPPGAALDLGCGAGRTAFDLAARADAPLVLGVDLNLALLRLARRVACGEGVAYARRRIGLAYDARRFAADLPGRSRVDFWACDAQALPLRPQAAGLVVALNLLDCVADGRALLAAMAGAAMPGGAVLLATPFDWSTRATPLAGWLGGHSQRGPGRGAAEPLLRALVTEGAHPLAVPGLEVTGEADQDWQTRLHDRAGVQYRTHLLAMRRA